MLSFHSYCLSLIELLPPSPPLPGAIASAGKLSSAASLCFSSNATTSLLRDPNPNWSNYPPRSLSFSIWCDFEHQMPATEESNTAAMTTVQYTLFFVSRSLCFREMEATMPICKTVTPTPNDVVHAIVKEAEVDNKQRAENVSSQVSVPCSSLFDIVTGWSHSIFFKFLLKF